MIHEDLETVDLVTVKVPRIPEVVENSVTPGETCERQGALHIQEASIEIDGIKETEAEIELDVCMLEQARLAQEEQAARYATDTRNAALEIDILEAPRISDVVENSETQETVTPGETYERQETLHVEEASIEIDGVRKTEAEIKADICMLEQARLAQEEEAARCATDTRNAALEIERLTQLLTEAKRERSELSRQVDELTRQLAKEQDSERSALVENADLKNRISEVELELASLQKLSVQQAATTEVEDEARLAHLKAVWLEENGNQIHMLRLEKQKSENTFLSEINHLKAELSKLVQASPADELIPLPVVEVAVLETAVAETSVVNASSLATETEVVESPAPVVVTTPVVEPLVGSVEQETAPAVVKPAAVESSALAVVETMAKEPPPIANLQCLTSQLVLRPPLPIVQKASPCGMHNGPLLQPQGTPTASRESSFLVQPGQLPHGSSTRPMRPVAPGSIAQVRTCMPHSMAQPMVNTSTGSFQPLST